MAAKKKSATKKNTAPAVLSEVAAVPLGATPAPVREVKPAATAKRKHTTKPLAASNSPICTKEQFGADECHCAVCAKERLT